MCIKNLYQPASDEKLPHFLKENITKSIDLTGDAFFLKVFGSNPKVAEVYYEEFYKKIFYRNAKRTLDTLNRLVTLKAGTNYFSY